MSSGQKPRWPQFYPKMKVRNKGRRRPSRVFVYDEHFKPIWPPRIAGVDMRNVTFVCNGRRLSGSLWIDEDPRAGPVDTRRHTMTTTPLAEAERAQLRTLCDTALPGPWETHYDEGTGEVSIQVTEDHPIRGSWIEVATTAQWPDDMENSPTAEFIAAARTAIPALLDRIEELEDAILRVFGTDS